MTGEGIHFTAELAGVPVEIRCRYEENRAFLRDYRTEKAPVLTFAGILGLVLASPVALLIQNSECFSIATAGNWLVSLVCLAIGFLVAWLLSKLDNKE